MTESIVNQLTKHPEHAYRKRNLAKISQIILHHFAGMMSIEDAANYHVNGHGWPGIGYHYVIDNQGNTYATNNLDTVSYHCAGQNTRSIGIALQGNFEEQPVPAKQINALLLLVDGLKQTFGQLPVYGHHEFSNTLCPGKYLKCTLPDLNDL